MRLSLIQDMTSQFCLSIDDAWVDALIDRGFLFHLDGEVSMEQFTKGINRILSDIGCEKQLDLTLLDRMYQEELQNYCLNGKEIHEEIN